MKTEFRPRILKHAYFASNQNLNHSACLRDTETCDTILRDTEKECSDNYSRYLVLEVYRRETVDERQAETCGGVRTEKVLRMFDEWKCQERYCYLREDWEMTEVEPGDVVHVTGR